LSFAPVLDRPIFSVESVRECSSLRFSATPAERGALSRRLVFERRPVGSCTAAFFFYLAVFRYPIVRSRDLAGFLLSPAALMGFVPSQFYSCPRVTRRFRLARPPAVFRSSTAGRFHRGVGRKESSPTSCSKTRPATDARRGSWVFPAGNPRRDFFGSRPILPWASFPSQVFGRSCT